MRVAMGQIVTVMRTMGVRPWQAFEAAAAAVPALREDCPGRPYLADRQGRRWLLDGSGEVA